MFNIQDIVRIVALLSSVMRDSEIDNPLGIPPLNATDLSDSYDFIVVGSGSTGSVVAARLAETSASVLLLEAGTSGSSVTEVPMAFASVLGSSLDWSYLTEPDGQSCLGMKNRQCLWPAGKVLGGTSVINHMVYARGDQEDYNTWERRGNPGWGWDDVLPYFKKSEDQQNNLYASNTKYHSVGGPLPVSDGQFEDPHVEAFLKTAQFKGFTLKDLNTGNVTGFGTRQVTALNGRRFSTAKSFLESVMEQNNVSILIEAVVTRLLISTGYKPQAKGVVFTRHGVEHMVHARKEVIVSCGVVGSPKLLMLSGVGPRQHLQQLGIPVMADLPVGQNMQSHVGTIEVVFTTEEPEPSNTTELLSNPSNLFAFLSGSGGPLAYSDLTASGVYRTGLDLTTSWPDMEIFLHTLKEGSGPFVKRMSNSNKQLGDRIEAFSKNQGFILIPGLLHPKSRGTIRLRSRNPLDQAVISPNYFDHPLDVSRLVSAIKFAISFGSSENFKKFGTKLNMSPLRFCEVHELHSDSYWECAIRYFSYPMYHDACTCPMGPTSDKTAVVSSRLLVHGVRGLRVADASVMPELIAANTNAACIMIGEKVADLIKQDWGLY